MSGMYKGKLDNAQLFKRPYTLNDLKRIKCDYLT